MVAVVLNTIMMDKTRPEMAGVDYTLQGTILFMGSLTAAGISGFLTTAIGYSGVFIVGGTITLANTIVVAKAFFHEPST